MGEPGEERRLTRRQFLRKAAGIGAGTVAALSGVNLAEMLVSASSEPFKTSLPEAKIQPRGPEYQLAKPGNYGEVIKLESGKSGGLAIWGEGFWGKKGPEVLIRPYNTNSGEPVGIEKNPFGLSAIDPKITSPQEGLYIVTATSNITPHDLPYIPGFGETAVRLVNQQGENLRAFAVYIPEPTEREIPPGAMYEVVAGYEHDGRFIFAAIIPVENLVQKLALLPPGQRESLSKLLAKFNLGEPLPKNVLAAGEFDLDRLDKMPLPEFDYIAVNGDLDGFKVTPLPNNRFFFSYYVDNELKLALFENNKFGEARPLGSNGILKDRPIYDENSGKLLVALRKGFGSEFWDILVLDSANLEVLHQLAFPRPRLNPGEVRRKIDRLVLVPTKLGVNCLAQIGYTNDGETKVRPQIGYAVLSGSADRISPLQTIGGESFFADIAPAVNGMLLAKVIPDQSGEKNIPVVQRYSTAAFSEVHLPITNKAAAMH